MPTVHHESFVRAFEVVLAGKLATLTERATVDGAFVATGSADVILDRAQAAAVAADTGLPVKTCYRPDGSWRLDRRGCRPNARPGLVLEVCATQRLEDAVAKVDYYFGSTNGAVRGVVIVDLTHQGLRATVSVCVADFVDARSVNESPTIEHKWLMDDQEFCDAKGNLSPSAQPICLPLAIFYPWTSFGRIKGVIEISARELFGCLIRPAAAPNEEDAEPELPQLKFNIVGRRPSKVEDNPSSSTLPTSPDAGAIRDDADSSFALSETSNSTLAHCMSGSSSEGSDDLEIDMFTESVVG